MSTRGLISAAIVAAISAGLYRMVNPARNFESEDIPSLHGKIALVTGANTGIGLESTFQLASNGAHVVMACRSEARATAAIAALHARDPTLSLEFMRLDLGDLESVESFSKTFAAAHSSLDLLLANAGVMATPYTLSTDGIELQFAVNHVGHFLLTHRMLPALARATDARVVVVSSLAHTFVVPNGTFSEAVVNQEEGYSPFRAYGRSKLANLQFTRALASRLRRTAIRTNAVHPGYVRTELMRNLQDVFGSWINPVLPIANKFALSPEDGALTQLYVSTSPDIVQRDVRGKYFVPIGVEATPTALALDENEAEKLWVLTTDMLAARGHSIDTVDALVSSAT